MPEAFVQEVPTEKIAEAGSTREQVACRRCGSSRVHRVFREGFLQQKIYPLLGYFPWRCKTCGDLAMLRKRHRTRPPHGDAGSQERRTD